MENWILAILALSGKLAAAAEMYANRAEATALDLKGNVTELCEQIMELNDIKRRIVNMRVMFDMLKSELSETEFSLISEYASKSLTEIALCRKLSRTSVYRMLKRALKKAEKILWKIRVDFDRMNSDYLGIPLCRAVYLKVKRAKTKEKAYRDEGESSFRGFNISNTASSGKHSAGVITATAAGDSSTVGGSCV